MASSWGNSWLNSWGNSWGVLASIVPAPSKGGIDPEEAKRYRKYLEKLTGINKPNQVTKQVIKAAEVVKTLPVKANTVKAIVQKREIDYDALEKEISVINAYIDKMEQRAIEAQKQLRNKDDEIALLLLLS